jgi:uncharacterized protein (TIGR00251 family)
MAKREFKITQASRGAALAVKIIPKANTTGIAGIEPDGTVRIRLTAPPVDDQDNQELVQFLAGLFNIGQQDVEIVAGAESRNKLISLLNIGSADVERIVNQSVTGG